MDIRELVVAAKNGDASAQAQLYEETNKKAYYLALRLLQNPDDAMDVLQDSYIAAFRALDSLQNPEAFPAWLAQIVSNRSKNLLRTRNRFVEPNAEEEERDYFSNIEDMDEAILPHEVLDKAEIRKLVLQMVDDLPHEQRECIMLYYFSGLTTEQIAETQECSQGTVKSRLNYARKKLKENVLDLEKRTDIRLHALVPIGLLFAGFAADLPGQQAFAATWEGISAGLATESAASGAGAVSNTASSAAKAGTATVIKGKTIALIAAAVVVVGGVAGVGLLGGGPSDAEGGSSGAGGLSIMEQNEVVSFHSPEFEAAFAEAAGLTVGEITKGDLAEVWGIEVDQGLMIVNDMFAGMEWDELYDHDTGELIAAPENRLTNLDMTDLALFPQLETLTLRETSAIHTAALAELDLKYFWLMDSSIEDWSHISGLKNLTNLNISSSTAATGTLDFSSLPMLKAVRLTINNAGEWNAAFQNLSALKNVVYFSGQCFDGAPDLSFFFGMPQLEGCHIYMEGPVTLHAFDNNTNLRLLEVNAMRVPGEEPSIVSGVECVRIFYLHEPVEQAGQILNLGSAEYEMVDGIEAEHEVYKQRYKVLNDEILDKERSH